GSGTDDLVERGGRAVFTVSRGGRAEDLAVFIFPLAIPVFFRASFFRMTAVEITHPLRKIGAIVSRSNPVAGFGIDPVGAVTGKSGRQHGGAIFQRDRKYSRLAARGQLQFVPKRVAHEIVRRRTRTSTGDSDKFRRGIFDRRYPLLLLRVPPFVGHDPVSAGVGSGEESSVSGSSAGVGVIVIAVGEVSAVIEKHSEPAVAKLVAITFEIIAAKLIDDDDDNQLGPGVVSGRERARNQSEQQQDHKQRAGKSHCELVYRRRTLNAEDAEATRRSRRATQRSCAGFLSDLCVDLCVLRVEGFASAVQTAGVHGIALFS